MAFNPAPSTWLGAGYSLASHILGFTGSSASSNVTIPNLPDADANATTGDIRKIFFNMDEMEYQAWVTQVAAGNQPTKMTFIRSSIENSDGTFSRTYTKQYIVASTGAPDVVAE